MNRWKSHIIAFAAAIATISAVSAASGESTSAPVRIRMEAKETDPEPIVIGTNQLLRAQAAPMHGGASAEAEMLGFDTDVQVTTIALAGKTAWVGVRSKGGKVQYGVRIDGASEPTKSAEVARSSGRSYTKVDVMLPGGGKIPLYLRSTGETAQVIRYFVPMYYEGQWKQSNGKELRVALFPISKYGVVPEITDAQLMMDLDDDNFYKAKSPTIELIERARPFRVGGVTYEASVDTAAGELMLTPVEKEATELMTLRIGEQAPDFTAEDFEGKKVKLSELRGKFVFFDVWAVWCGPCRAEIPNIQKAHEGFGKDVAILGVSIDDALESAKEFVEKEKMTYRQLWQQGGFQAEICKLYQVNGIPATFLIDPQGNLAATNLRGEEIEKALSMAAKYDQPEARAFFSEKKETGRLTAQVENLQDLGRADEAIKLLKEFQQSHPNSPNLEMVNRYLDYLEAEE